MTEQNPTLEMRNRLIAYLRQMERGLDTAGYTVEALHFEQLVDQLENDDTVADVLYQIIEHYNAENGNALVAISAIAAVTGEDVDTAPYEVIDQNKMVVA